MSKVILITGVSSGFGLSMAQLLAEKGHKIYGTSRRAIDAVPGVTLLKMDVLDSDSVKEAVSEVIQKEGVIDVLINNAGMGISGAIEEASDEEIHLQMGTNFVGTVHMIQSVLPSMRQHRNGLIINFSSIGGLMGLPFQGFYSASKFAVEGMSEALRMELKAFNIKLVLVNPGDFKTNFTANRRVIKNAGEQSAYQKQFTKTMKIVEKDETSGLTPDVLAKKICKIVEKKRPAYHYVIASFEQKLGVFLKRHLPDSWYDLMLEKYYGIH